MGGDWRNVRSASAKSLNIIHLIAKENYIFQITNVKLSLSVPTYILYGPLEIKLTKLKDELRTNN